MLGSCSAAPVATPLATSIVGFLPLATGGRLLLFRFRCQINRRFLGQIYRPLCTDRQAVVQALRAHKCDRGIPAVVLKVLGRDLVVGREKCVELEEKIVVPFEEDQHFLDQEIFSVSLILESLGRQ